MGVFGHIISSDLLMAFFWGLLALLVGFPVRSLALSYLRRLSIDKELLDVLARHSRYWIWIIALYALMGNIPASPIWFLYAYRGMDAYLILSITYVCAIGSTLLARELLHKKYPQLPLATGFYRTLRATVGTIGGMIIFHHLGIYILPALAILAIGGIALIFAFQETLINLSAGFHILTEQSFQPGDHIRLGSGEEGQVLAVNWRTTRIQTPQQQVLIIPNRKVAQTTIFHIRPTQTWNAESVRVKLKELLAGRPFVLVSNREPYVHQKSPEGPQWTNPAGGVTAALDPLMQAVGGLWVAWGSGSADRESSDPSGKVMVPPDQPTYTLKRIWLDEEELTHYYAGYANGVIWPLCHLALDKVEHRETDWQVYREVNRRFAEGVIEEVPKDKDEGLVWVHDYQLALVPRFLREKNPFLQICHFWHIPWPPFDVFRALPERREILEGLLAADLIGFQVDRFLENFAQCVEKTLGEKVNGDRLILGNHQTLLKTFPISIDFDQFHQWATQPQAEREMQAIRDLLNLPPEGFVGIGVDRLEYTKALLERFQAIDLFFTRYPQYKGKFTFVQVAPTSRAEMEVYKDYAEKVRALIEEINGRHASDGWQPIHFQQEKLSHATLALYYRMADLAIISSTADGMNLVAKEYVASQVDEKGLLLLSEMAGASEQLEGAFLINPYNIEGVCEAIRTALGTPQSVRRLLMRRMREQVRDYTLYRWVGETFSTLETFKRR
jgi:alpha,alpha-trehalose-phosphate synthase [UDP-forming]